MGKRIAWKSLQGFLDLMKIFRDRIFIHETFMVSGDKPGEIMNENFQRSTKAS
jgi:hypothetical protein